MYLPYVNVKIGTDSEPRFSHGNTLPLTQLPFAMASFCPQTEIVSGKEGWFYKPNAPYLEGKVDTSAKPLDRGLRYVFVNSSERYYIKHSKPGVEWNGHQNRPSIPRLNKH